MIGRTPASGVPADQVRAVGDQLVEDHDPGVLDPDGDLVLGEDHPLGLDAAELGLLQLHAARHHRAGPGDRDRLPGLDIGGAAHDLRDVIAADVDPADAQAVGVGVAAGLEHLADDEVLERVDAVVVDGLDLRAGHREALLDLPGREAGVRVGVEPFQGRAHQPNCSRKRRSLSKSARMSVRPCLSWAMRSMPRPQAKPWTFSGS